MYDKMQEHDKKMAAALVDALLAKGCLVSIYDGEDWACKHSNNRAVILDAVGNTDQDEVVVRYAATKLGWFLLVYGKDPGEIIDDYTANDFCQSIVDKVQALSPMLGE